MGQFSRLPRSRLWTDEISVDGKIFGPYERNLFSTFPLNGKTFCRISKFSFYKMAGVEAGSMLQEEKKTIK